MRDPAETFLGTFHRREPRATPRSLAGLKTADGSTSYQHLAAVIPRTPQPLAILDLGCGDGHLLADIAARWPAARLHGVDLCAADLALARAHPLLAQATLREERAQSLSAAAASFDVVLCHLALMLMSDLPLVASEVARVLKPSGCFAAVLPDESVRTPVFDLFCSCYAELARAERAQPPALGDARAFDARQLRSVFEAAAPDRELSLRPFSLHLHGSFSEVWASLSLTYLLPLLSPPAQLELQQRFQQRVQPLADATGRLPFELALLLLEWRPRPHTLSGSS
jgi:ubiquinone/menaquinone biosynthesis C-methylase UbiE